MIFKNLLQNNSWPSISSIFLEIYPDAAKNMEGYKAVFKRLILMDPEEIDMSIIITKIKDDDEEYTDVSGLYNNPKNEEEHYSQGIEFTPWRKWLGMDISAESLVHFSEQEISVHCLYEMTYVGFSEEKIQEALNRLEERREVRESMTEKERYASVTSIEELLNELNEGDDQN